MLLCWSEKARLIEGDPSGEAGGEGAVGFLLAVVTEGEVAVVLGVLAIVHRGDLSVNGW